jgi:hypothetical protein
MPLLYICSSAIADTAVNADKCQGRGTNKLARQWYFTDVAPSDTGACRVLADKLPVPRHNCRLEKGM